MASGKRVLKVVISPQADNELDEIYRYNVKNRGLAAADRYIQFLHEKIESLAVEYNMGKPIESRPDLLYILMKPRSAGDGHLAVYKINYAAATVEIWFVFHTKQDWANKL